MAPGEPVARAVVSGPADPQLLDLLHAAIVRLWEAAPLVPATDRVRFETALTEIATNIVCHAVPVSGGAVAVDVELAVTHETLEGELVDDGADQPVDIDPAAPSDTATSGRGLLLIQRSVDHFDFTRRDRHNVWRVRRSYGSPSGAAS